jgi:hypothetical protein
MPKNASPMGIQHFLQTALLGKITEAERVAELQNRFTATWHKIAADQRSEIYENLKEALLKNAVTDFEIKNWQRSVHYKYSLHPLCTIGSIRYIGGRFNYGDEIREDVSSFPALYIAKDKKTALQEHLAQPSSNDSTNQVSSVELALSKPDSNTTVSVNGKLSKVINLNDAKSLKDFINIIKKFKLPPEFSLWAKNAHMPSTNLGLVRSITALINVLLMPNWRAEPVVYNTPSTSQEFGELVMLAGIDGIIYPSKFDEQPCAAIFLQNFCNNDSYIEISGDVPDVQMVTKIDGSNYKLAELEYKHFLATNNNGSSNALN